MWSVRFALTLAAGLFAVGVVLLGLGRSGGPNGRRRLVGPNGRRRLRATAPYPLAAGGVIGLYAVWQFALDVLVVHTAGAVGRGRAIATFERAVHLPSEASVQRLFLHAPLLVEAANRYYAWVDFPGLCAALAWLFWRHRERFAHYLVTLIGVTAACTVLQAIPVAPPRLTPGFGFIDTGPLFDQMVYPPGGSDPGVLTSMPSVHVAWAVLVAVIICGAGAGRWRWAFIAHPVLTMVVVVVTGNHFWADGIVAGAILGATMAVQAGVIRLVGKGQGLGSTRHWYDAGANQARNDLLRGSSG